MIPDIRNEFLNTVGSVVSRVATFKTAGQGVFLSPTLFLTAKHTISRADVIEVEAADGQRTWASDCNPLVQNALLDVAVIRLCEPIGTAFARCPAGESPEIRDGWLAGRFDGAAAKLCRAVKDHGPGQGGAGKYESEFSAAIRVAPGCSGIPVLDEAGTLLTIVTRRDYERQEALARMTAAGLSTSTLYPFLTPDPVQFTRWLSGARLRLGLGG